MSDRVDTSGYTCSHYETEMERLERTNKKMKQRIAELEAEREKYICEYEFELRRLRDALRLREEESTFSDQRIAELETAQQWHDARVAPTEEGEYEVIQYADTPTRRFAFWKNGEWRNQHEQTLGGITHYTFLRPPTMPERDES